MNSSLPQSRKRGRSPPHVVAAFRKSCAPSDFWVSKCGWCGSLSVSIVLLLNVLFCLGVKHGPVVCV